MACFEVATGAPDRADAANDADNADADDDIEDRSSFIGSTPRRLSLIEERINP